MKYQKKPLPGAIYLIILYLIAIPLSSVGDFIDSLSHLFYISFFYDISVLFSLGTIVFPLLMVVFTLKRSEQAYTFTWAFYGCVWGGSFALIFMGLPVATCIGMLIIPSCIAAYFLFSQKLKLAFTPFSTSGYVEQPVVVPSSVYNAVISTAHSPQPEIQPDSEPSPQQAPEPIPQTDPETIFKTTEDCVPLYCRKCGSVIPIDSIYCPECGAKVIVLR